MRAVLFSVMVTALCCAAIAVDAMPARADVTVKVYVNGKVQRYNPPAIVRAGKTYVPLRQGASSLGLEVKWLADQNVAQVCSDTACILIPKKEGIIVNGRLLLPLRKMGESLGADVKWDGKKKAVAITKKKSGSGGPRFD